MQQTRHIWQHDDKQASATAVEQSTLSILATQLPTYEEDAKVELQPPSSMASLWYTPHQEEFVLTGRETVYSEHINQHTLRRVLNSPAGWTLQLDIPATTSVLDATLSYLTHNIQNQLPVNLFLPCLFLSTENQYGQQASLLAMASVGLRSLLGAFDTYRSHDQTEATFTDTASTQHHAQEALTVLLQKRELAARLYPKTDADMLRFLPTLAAEAFEQLQSRMQRSHHSASVSQQVQQLYVLSSLALVHASHPTATTMRDAITTTWIKAFLLSRLGAPGIDAKALQWLCESGVRPTAFLSTLVHTDDFESADETLLRDLIYQAARGTCDPTGMWDVVLPHDLPVLPSNGLQTVRVSANREGMWVRLEPASAAWSTLVWWKPSATPPRHWQYVLPSIAFGDLASVLHRVLAALWHDVCVAGPVRVFHQAPLSTRRTAPIYTPPRAPQHTIWYAPHSKVKRNRQSASHWHWGSQVEQQAITMERQRMHAHDVDVHVRPLPYGQRAGAEARAFVASLSLAERRRILGRDQLPATGRRKPRYCNSKRCGARCVGGVGLRSCVGAWCWPYEQRQEHMGPLSKVHQDSGRADYS